MKYGIPLRIKHRHESDKSFLLLFFKKENSYTLRF